MRYQVYRQKRGDNKPRQAMDTDSKQEAMSHAKRISNETNWVYVYDSEEKERCK